MSNYDAKKSGFAFRRSYLIAGIILWTVILGASLAWNLFNASRHSVESARIEARAVFERSIIFRRWSAIHGGVYVVVDGDVKPNPFLADIPERDILTPSGRTLTLLNPAVMMRQTSRLAEKEYGARERLVSLDPINPENLPDAWELDALMAFKKGESEVYSLERMSGEGAQYMRLMRPVREEKSCLSCHPSWKAREGGLQAGFSVSFPMTPFNKVYREHALELYRAHFALWLAGLGGILIAFRILRQSEKKRRVVEGALRESEDHFSTVFKESPSGMFIVDMDFKILDVNDALCRMLGCSKEEFSVSTLIDCVWSESAKEDATRIFGEMFSETRPFYKVEKSCVKINGSSFWVALTSSILHDDKGLALYGFGRVEDISQRKAAEDKLHRARFDLELRVSERTRELTKANEALRKEIIERQIIEDELRLFKILINGSNDCIAVIDSEKGRYLEANDKLCKSLGYSREELLRKNVVDVSSLISDNESWKKEVGNLREKGVVHKEGEYSRRDGTSFAVDINVALISHGDKNYIVSIARDITRRRREEAEKEEIKVQLQQSQRLEAVGRLAGGIAHDFNNIQSAIKNLASLGMSCLDSSSASHAQGGEPWKASLQEYFEKIDGATNRASALTRQLLTFSRHDKKNLINVDICKVISEAMELISPLIGEGVSVDMDLGDTPLIVRADKGNLEQVVANLALNARDAMAGGGRLVIRANIVSMQEEDRAGIIDPDYLGEGGAIGDFVRLRVADSGHGISPEDMGHIFEPFYSTKDRDKGAGLGLAVVYGIVKDHKGFIGLSSKPGSTVFSIYLPLGKGALAQEDDESLALAPRQAAKGEKIMLVEDDQLVRESTCMILRAEGYEVVTVKGSTEALVLYAKEGAGIDLVISDGMIPGKTGPELLNELSTMKKDFKGLLYSGYMKKDVKNLLIGTKAIRFIEKPYDVREFLTLIREVLTES
jgi:PAS domain S-box-containing protein